MASTPASAEPGDAGGILRHPVVALALGWGWLGLVGSDNHLGQARGAPALLQRSSTSVRRTQCVPAPCVGLERGGLGDYRCQLNGSVSCRLPYPGKLSLGWSSRRRPRKGCLVGSVGAGSLQHQFPPLARNGSRPLPLEPMESIGDGNGVREWGSPPL